MLLGGEFAQWSQVGAVCIEGAALPLYRTQKDLVIRDRPIDGGCLDSS